MYHLALKWDLFTVINCLSDCPMLICFIDIKDWYFALCSFMFRGKERGRGWRQKEEIERLRVPIFSVISFPARKKSHFTIFYMSIPVQLHAPWSHYSYFIIESIPFLWTISFLSVPHQVYKTKFLKGLRHLFS